MRVNSKNRITNPGFAYDDAGNLTSDGLLTYTWGAENRLTSTNGVSYTYDGDGRRVMKSNGTLYWYSPSGEILEETNLSGSLLSDYIYFAGQRIARRDASGVAYYYYADRLGSARLVKGSNNAQQESDYYPFGGERVVSGSVDNHYKFTGMERDGESSLDHTLFRQYASNLGRWPTPDFVRGDVSNPQSWNRYAYVVNNPTNLIDPLGAQEREAGNWEPRFRDQASGNSTFCVVDRMNVPCRTAFGLLATGAAYIESVAGSPTGGPAATPGSTIAVQLPGSCVSVNDSASGTSSKTCEPASTVTVQAPSLNQGSIGDLVYDFAKNVPLAGTLTGSFPVAGPAAGLGPTVQFAYFPFTGQFCGGGGVAVTGPAGKAANGGPLIHGNLSNPSAILSGFSFSANVQVTNTIGYQVVWNSSGVLGGPTVGFFGVSLSATYSGCTGPR